MEQFRSTRMRKFIFWSVLLMLVMVVFGGANSLEQRYIASGNWTRVIATKTTTRHVVGPRQDSYNTTYEYELGGVSRTYVRDTLVYISRPGEISLRCNPANPNTCVAMYLYDVMFNWVVTLGSIMLIIVWVKVGYRRYVIENSPTLVIMR